MLCPLMAQKYMTRNAEVYFISDKDAVEVVEATNNQVGAVIDLENGEIAFQIQMIVFRICLKTFRICFVLNFLGFSKLLRLLLNIKKT